ncbi:Uncharacterised protein [Mycobacteroides abscessus subsp. abscessus]|nr:Uncharacterised protein [Mycobacteroides abscessus subsp. abscessus]
MPYALGRGAIHANGNTSIPRGHLFCGGEIPPGVHFDDIFGQTLDCCARMCALWPPRGPICTRSQRHRPPFLEADTTRSVACHAARQLFSLSGGQRSVRASGASAFHAFPAATSADLCSTDRTGGTGRADHCADRRRSAEPSPVRPSAGLCGTQFRHAVECRNRQGKAGRRHRIRRVENADAYRGLSQQLSDRKRPTQHCDRKHSVESVQLDQECHFDARRCRLYAGPPRSRGVDREVSPRRDSRSFTCSDHRARPVDPIVGPAPVDRQRSTDRGTRRRPGYRERGSRAACSAQARHVLRVHPARTRPPGVRRAARRRRRSAGVCAANTVRALGNQAARLLLGARSVRPHLRIRLLVHASERLFTARAADAQRRGLGRPTNHRFRLHPPGAHTICVEPLLRISVLGQRLSVYRTVIPVPTDDPAGTSGRVALRRLRDGRLPAAEQLHRPQSRIVGELERDSRRRLTGPGNTSQRQPQQ